MVAFEFIIIEYWPKDNLINREQFWLDWYKSYNKDIGYNICKIADSRKGILHSEEAKLKMSESNKGKVKSAEWQAKITAAITGLKRDPKVGKAHSKFLTGRKLSNQTRANMAKGQLGRKHSEESKLKRSLKLKGRVKPKLEIHSYVGS